MKVCLVVKLVYFTYCGNGGMTTYWQALLAEPRQWLPHHDTAYAAAYLDGVVIHSVTWQDHFFHTENVLTELRWARLTANPQRFHLGLTESQYLGYSIGPGPAEATGEEGGGGSALSTAGDQKAGTSVFRLSGLLLTYHT